MRNPFATSKLANVLTASRWARARPDMLRREALIFNTGLMAFGVAIAFPSAFYFAASGRPMLLLVATVVAALLFLTAVMHLRKRNEAAIGLQTGIIGFAAVLLSAAYPYLVDFGLALAMMAALYALLVSQSRYRHIAWGVPALAFATSALGVLGAIPAPFDPAAADGLHISVIAGILAPLIIAITANRLNAAATAFSQVEMKTFSMLVESVQDAVVRYDEEGKVMFLSKSASKLFGCQRYELDGTGLFERIHVMDRPAYLAAVSDAGTRGLSRVVEIRMRREMRDAGKQGSGFVWVELSLSPVVDEPGMPGRWEIVGVMRDVSARKDNESANNRARLEAEQASEAKSRFLATIGHELRTPLNAIVGFSDMMKEGIGGQLNPTHHEYAGLICQSGQHLLDVVNMLLDMSKLEAGRFELQADLLSPASIVEPCLHLVATAARNKGVVIACDVPETLPRIVGDERACRQMLINLLSNAIKFSHKDATVTLSMHRQGRMLNITVADEGIGMDADIISRVGEPFLQAQDGLSRRYEGTGLGLSIVKGLVDLHDGQLHIVSEAGRGTRVTILLPLDGPARLNPPTAEVEPIRKDITSNDEAKWLEDEKRSAAR